MKHSVVAIVAAVAVTATLRREIFDGRKKTPLRSTSRCVLATPSKDRRLSRIPVSFAVGQNKTGDRFIRTYSVNRHAGGGYSSVARTFTGWRHHWGSSGRYRGPTVDVM